MIAADRPWHEYVRPYATPGLSSCIAGGLLRLDGVRMAATWIDLTSMRLAEWAIAMRQSVILISPDPYDLLVPLTAAAVHVWRMAERKKAIGGYPTTDAKVAVITSAFRLRTAYRRLDLGGARLFDAVPAATRLPTGAIAVLGSGGRTDWGTLFVNRASDLRGIKGITLIVVDLPVYDWPELAAIDAPKVLIGHNAADYMVHQLARTMPVFAWDTDDLRGLGKIRVIDGPALQPVAARLERLAAGSTCTPVVVPSQQVSENAALFWGDIGPLHRAARESYLARDLTSEAHELFQDLLHLAVPTAFYEQQSGVPVAARLRDIAHDEYQARGDLHDMYLPMVRAELEGMASAIGEKSRKTDALVSLLREAVDQRKDVMVVARTATLARIHRAHLATFPELRRVRVASLSGVSEEMPADVAILTGLAPAWARHIYGSGIASELRVLTYATEAPLMIPDPFVEVEHVRKTIAYQRRYGSWLSRAAMKSKCWSALSGEVVPVTDDRPLPPVVDPSSVDVVPVPAAPDVPPGLWEVGVASLELPDGGEPGTLSHGPSDRPLVVEAVRVLFDDGRWALLDAAGTVTRFSAVLQRAEPGTEVKKLQPGDEVVFLDGDARKDLLDKVLEVAKEIPHLATSATWVAYWREALAKAKRKYGSYTALGVAMRARGCQRQTQTIRLWIVGAIIGPSDRVDVRRVGEIIDDAPLRDHHQVVYGGIEAFRGAHAQLMERVGALAMHVGPGARAGAIRPDVVIDARSGLTAADFQGCIDILRIRSIAAAGSVAGAAVGQLREAREMGALR